MTCHFCGKRDSHPEWGVMRSLRLNAMCCWRCYSERTSSNDVDPAHPAGPTPQHGGAERPAAPLATSHARRERSPHHGKDGRGRVGDVPAKQHDRSLPQQG